MNVTDCDSLLQIFHLHIASISDGRKFSFNTYMPHSNKREKAL